MAYVRDTGKFYVWDSTTNSYIESSVTPTTTCTLTVFATPANATIVLEATGFEQVGDSITVPYGTTVNYTVSCEGYVTVSDSIELLEDSNLTIILEQIATYTLTVNPTPVDAEVVLTATGYTQQGNSITVQTGTLVRYTVFKEGYTTVSNSVAVSANTTLDIELEEAPDDPHIHIQLLRGTTNKNEAYIGREGELTYDIEKKNVRVHDGETPGGKIVSADIDDVTITNDANNKLQTVAKKNQNRANGATSVIYDWEGTLEQYNAQHIETLHPDWICYINDDNEGGISVYTKEEIDRELVHKTGNLNENINGIKTFKNTIKATEIQFNDIPLTEGQYMRDITGVDTEGARISGIRFEKSANERRTVGIFACNENNTNLGGISVFYNPETQTNQTCALKPVTESNNTDIVTTNWINQYRTNCLTKIPQDIKLELDNGTLTLKAGSKVYVPNGSGVFDTVTTTADISTSRTDSSDCMVWYNTDGTLTVFPAILFYSGSTAPTAYTFMFWYDTTNNKCKRTSDGGSTWEEGKSFPLCLVATDGTKISSIKQVFNGFGYIGGVYYCLPGVSGIFPAGRNDDGTMKNSIFTVDNVLTYEVIAGTHVDQSIRLSKTSITSGDMIYDEEMNINYVGTRSDPSSERHFASVGRYSCADGKITRFVPDSVCHYIHAGELTSTLIEAIYPVGSIYIGTTASCPISLLIPNSTWEKVATDRVLQGSSSSHAANTTINAGLPNIKGTFAGYELGRSGQIDTTGAFYEGAASSRDGTSTSNGKAPTIGFNASRSNSIYSDSVSTVQPPAYVVNIWRRTA